MEGKRAIESAKKRKHWEEVLADWQASGLSQVEFCRRSDIVPHRFHYWKRRLRKSPTAVSFVELELSGGRAFSSVPLGLIVDGRFRVEVHDGFNPVTLAAIIRTLSRL